MKYVLLIIFVDACASDGHLEYTLRKKGFEGISIKEGRDEHNCTTFRARTMLGHPVQGIVCEDENVRIP